jgi:SAM-dependent methyltransferase
MTELQYYENPILWERGKYEGPDEVRRFGACARLIPQDVASLLDVGAGNGAFLRHLEQGGQIPRLAGVERAEAAIRASVCTTPLYLGSIEDLPFEDRSFDLVASLEVIEHLPFGVYETGLAELQRVAAKYLLVSVPYRESRALVRCPYCGCSFHPSFHMRIFDEDVLSGIFGGFRLVDVIRIQSRNDFVFGPLLRRVIRATSSPERLFPDRAVCPQCNYSRRGDGGEQEAVPTRRRGAVRSLVKRVLPRRNRYRWITALYERVAG